MGSSDRLLADVPFFGGTSANFNELNRNRECVSGADGVAYSLNPQVHAFDDLSLMENIAGQPEALSTLRTFTSLPVAVSPIALRVPSSSADPRQSTQFAAAWTLASIAALSRAGADSLTYFERRLGLAASSTEVRIRCTTSSSLSASGRTATSSICMFQTSCVLRVSHASSMDWTVLALANLTDGPCEVDVRPGDGLTPIQRRLQPYEVARVD